jgi:hypothetical protein
MKYLFILALFISFSSCEKCYECDIDYGNGQSFHKEVCKGDSDYDDVVEFGAARDSAGNAVPCQSK